jgi:hypothetical protein
MLSPLFATPGRYGATYHWLASLTNGSCELIPALRKCNNDDDHV